MLVSPAEPAALRALGTTSSAVEERGVDFLWFAKDGLVGCQRKEVKDLVASMRNGDRLARELGQIKDGNLACAWLLIEGDWRWTREGVSLTVPGFLRAQYVGIVMGIQVEYNMKVMQTDDLAQTFETLRQMESWHQKAKHGSLQVRPKSRAMFGTNGSREWCRHVLQSFTGISVGLADALLDHYGYLPLAWTEEDFESVPGIGKKRADSLRKALAYTEANGAPAA